MVLRPAFDGIHLGEIEKMPEVGSSVPDRRSSGGRLGGFVTPAGDQGGSGASAGVAYGEVMDMTPTGKMPFDPPNLPPTGPPTVQAPDPTGTLPLAFDATADQPASAIATRRFPGSRFFSEIAFQNLRSNLATVALALLLAAPIAGLAFFAIAGVRFAFDDRTFANSLGHSLAEFWYILLLFMIALAPVTFVLLRRSYDAAAGFVVDRGYWKVLLAVYVLFPLAAGIVAVVVGHLIAVLVVVGLLLIVLSITGGF